MADRIVFPSNLTGRPQWSHDGDRLGYSLSTDAGDFFEIISFSSGEVKRVRLPGARSPSWSPNGELVASITGDWQSTAHPLRVTRIGDGRTVDVTDYSAGEENPSWSRDGRHLFFVSNRGGSPDLWRQAIGADGSLEGVAEPLTAGLGIRSASFSGLLQGA